jgi:hypothetical protein
MSTRLRKEIYSALDDKYIKLLLGKGWKTFNTGEDFAEVIQSLLHVTPMTRRFDQKTVAALKNNEKNDQFKSALRLAISDAKANRVRKTLH